MDTMKDPQKELTCSCGAELLVKWSRDSGGGMAPRFPCPECGKEHTIPAPLLRLFRQVRGEWVEVSIQQEG